jgi:pyridoxine 5-phosphate synthase
MNGLRLGVNIDHVATLTGALCHHAGIKNVEPDPIPAASICSEQGRWACRTCAQIGAHQDRDVERLRQSIMTKLNLEMGNTEAIIDVALRIKPEEVCLVPEKREEVTTEGGLDVIAQRKELEPTIHRLQLAGIRVSLFIDPTLEQVDAATELGVEMVEPHTGALANAFNEKIKSKIGAVAAASGVRVTLQVNAGHGINYKNIAY